MRCLRPQNNLLLSNITRMRFGLPALTPLNLPYTLSNTFWEEWVMISSSDCSTCYRLQNYYIRYIHIRPCTRSYIYSIFIAEMLCKASKDTLKPLFTIYVGISATVRYVCNAKPNINRLCQLYIKFVCAHNNITHSLWCDIKCSRTYKQRLQIMLFKTFV